MDLYESILKAKQGDKIAMESIITSFTPFVIKTAAGVFISGMDMDDIIQIGYISIMHAVEKYDASKKGSFVKYVTQAIKQNYYYEIRKRVKMKAETSINKPISEDAEIIDVLASDSNIEDEYIDKENVHRLKEALSTLTSEERFFILAIFSRKSGIKSYSEENNINYRKCTRLKKKVIDKLRKVMV